MRKITKTVYLSFAGFVVFVILHNAVYAVFQVEEPVFFTLALLSGLVFLVSFIGNIVSFIAGKIRK